MCSHGSHSTFTVLARRDAVLAEGVGLNPFAISAEDVLCWQKEKTSWQIG
jgi:hypothetical protein